MAAVYLCLLCNISALTIQNEQRFEILLPKLLRTPSVCIIPFSAFGEQKTFLVEAQCEVNFLVDSLDLIDVGWRSGEN